MTEVSTRSIALECIILVAEEHRFSHTVLNDAREKYAWMSAEDRAFFTRLVHGTLEYLVQADRILEPRSSVKVRKMQPVIRNILRMSVYQLLYMDRVPARAVISEAVKLTEKRGLRGLKGFVNAVLRRVAAEREEILKELKSTEDLSLRCSMPEWMVRFFLSFLERETAEAVMTAFLQPRPSYVRLLGAEDAAEAELPSGFRRAELCPDVFCMAEGSGEEMISLLRSGKAYIQDLSSALAVRAAAPASGERVMDLCAAPGGKSIAAADLMEKQGVVYSFDLTEAKTELIRENAARCGMEDIVRAEMADAEAFREDRKETADLVIADLPCSGLGVLGQKPDIRLNTRPEDLKSLPELQRRILKNAAQYVKPGGRLLFCTCTLNPAENEENRLWFLEEEKAFSPVDLRDRLPELAAAEEEAVRTGKRKESGLSRGEMRLMPDLYPCDGFYFALFEKEGGI